MTDLHLNDNETIVQTEKSTLNEQDIDRIIQMAWEDRTPFEAIEFQFGLKEKSLTALINILFILKKDKHLRQMHSGQ